MMRHKLNLLFALLPEGCVCPGSWLSKNGYSRQLVYQYCKSGWLVPVAHGAFRRTGRPPEWQDVLISLDHFWGKKAHVAGVSALEMSGLGHFLPLSDKRKPLVVIEGEGRLPGWVKKVNAPMKLSRVGFFKTDPPEKTIMLKDWPRLPWPLRVSCPERAILEMLYKTPVSVSFEHASKVMENMLTLRPDVVGALLKLVKSIKVKRLFLYLADLHKLPLLKYLDRKGLFLGRGKRSLVKNGRLDRKYRITVPKDHDQY